jgi:hypothetical protein
MQNFTATPGIGEVQSGACGRHSSEAVATPGPLFVSKRKDLLQLPCEKGGCAAVETQGEFIRMAASPESRDLAPGQNQHAGEIERPSLSRRGFLSCVGAAGALLGATGLTGCSDATAPFVDAATQPQVDTLNFALNLEYLEATLYSYLVNGKDLDGSLTGGGPAPTGTPAQITFPNQQINDLFAMILFDEVSHVSALRTALGDVAVARPQLNLSALGAVTSANYLTIARFLEDVGATAYAGSAHTLTDLNATAAAQILAVEGFHAGALRLLCIQQNAPYLAASQIPADGYDIKPADPGTLTSSLAGPTTANGGFFAVAANGTIGQTNTSNGFAFQRTPSQVLALAYGSAAAGTAKGGFFPNGVNGNITTV